MAVNDVFSATIVGTFENTTINNVVYGQVTVENNQSTVLENFAELIVFGWCSQVRRAASDGFVQTNVVVRRLRPATSDVFVRDISIAGDLPSRPLPSTCYTLLKYYAQPYERSTAYHWKLSGMTTDMANQGLVTDEQVTRLVNLIESVTSSPYEFGGNTFALVRPPKSTDAPGVALPRIFKAYVNPTIRNLRSRQVYL